MRIAILTGASAGLGQAFFKELQVYQGKFDEIWLIARRRERMEEMAKNSAIPVKVLPLDLVDTDCIAAYVETLKAEKPDVRLLINNAGYGKLGNVDALSADDQAGMIDLNVRALTEMTVLTLPYMQKGAEIINICSIASFVPNTRLTVYSSTKAYVMSFTKGLREELKPRGINALAVCPGPMSTEFLPVAGIADGASKTFDTLPYDKPEKVARGALKNSAKRHAVYTPHPFFKMYRVMGKLFPHNLMMKLSKA